MAGLFDDILSAEVLQMCDVKLADVFADILAAKVANFPSNKKSQQ